MIQERGRRKIRIGSVTSVARDKTITVSVERSYRHSVYGRVVRKTKKFNAHDETNDARMGDSVEITETRPLSKTKCWRLSKIIERAK